MKLPDPLQLLAAKNPAILELTKRLDLVPKPGSTPPRHVLVSATVNSIINSVETHQPANRYSRPPAAGDGETEL